MCIAMDASMRYLRRGERCMKVTMLFLVSALIVGGCQTIKALSQADREFIDKYRVDPEIEAILDAHAQEIAKKLSKIARSGRQEHHTWVFDWLPGYHVKFNLARIHGMERMQRCIEKFNLDLLGVPDKRIYHVKGRPLVLNNMNYVVVVKHIPTDPQAKPLTLRHVQQLTTLMKETEYVDTTCTNCVRAYNDKIIMIDTESEFDRKKLLSRGYMRLIYTLRGYDRDYTKEALQYILGQMALLLTRYHGEERKQLHNEILSRLNRKPSSWDCVRYFEEQLQKA